MCGSSRDPHVVAWSVSMKDAKGAPSSRPDAQAIRVLGRAKPLFLILLQRLRQWREARKLGGADRSSLPEELTSALSGLTWGTTPLATVPSARGQFEQRT